jgi:hypothetical protein
MADRGRDLKISILADADQFDLAAPARDLEDLGDAARDAGRELEDLERADPKLKVGDAAKDAAKDLGKLGKATDELARDAKSTAAKVDSSFEKIAASSKAAAKDVDKSMDKAGEGLDEFKDESAGTAREAAASFTGSFDDVASTIQETMANAFAGFGPLGVAGGIAAAAGLGFLISSVTEAKERVKELASGLLDLKLDPSMDSAAGRIQNVLDTLKESGDLERFRSATEAAGISWSDYVTALAEGGDKADKVRAQLQPLIDEWGGASAMFTEAGGGANDLMNRLNDQAEATDQAAGSAQAYTDGALQGLIEKEAAATQAAEDHAAAVSEFGDALDAFTDPATVYSELLGGKNEAERKTAEATAKATKDQSDSWEDYVKSADVSVDEYLDSLDKQVAAQEAWAGNLSSLAQRGVEQGVLEQLARMGPEGAPLVAKLTKASDAELGRLVSLYSRQGKAAGDGVAEGIIDAGPRVTGNAKDLHGKVDAALSGQVTIPVGVQGPSSGDLAAMRSHIFGALSGMTVTVNAIAQSAFAGGRYTP